MIVYLNGRILPEEEAAIPIGDRGLLYGDGAFETMRARSGRAFRLDAHLARLRRGLQVLGIALALDDQALRQAIAETLDANDLQGAAVRLTVTRGSGGTRLDTEGCDSPTLLIRATPFAGYPDALYRRGLSAITVKGVVNPHSPLCAVKSLNRLEFILARQRARQSGADEALLADADGLVIEAAASNVFAVRGGAVYTPPEEAGALPGITRGCVLEVLAEEGIRVMWERLALADGGAAQFEEAFLTNSLMGVMPLTGVDGVAVGAGLPGTVTGRLRGAYESSAAGCLDRP